MPHEPKGAAGDHPHPFRDAGTVLHLLGAELAVDNDQPLEAVLVNQSAQLRRPAEHGKRGAQSRRLAATRQHHAANSRRSSCLEQLLGYIGGRRALAKHRDSLEQGPSLFKCGHSPQRGVAGRGQS